MKIITNSNNTPIKKKEKNNSKLQLKTEFFKNIGMEIKKNKKHLR